jgi:hypothetical protein
MAESHKLHRFAINSYAKVTIIITIFIAQSFDRATDFRYFLITDAQIATFWNPSPNVCHDILPASPQACGA